MSLEPGALAPAERPISANGPAEPGRALIETEGALDAPARVDRRDTAVASTTSSRASHAESGDEALTKS